MGEIGYLFNLILSFPIFNGLVLLDHLFGDFALAIVVLTLIIKLILFPLTLQQLKSMKAMQVLQPQMQEIRKKYANDQQAQMQAMQAMYKEYGINPAGGCLPLLIQLPVLYGLYAAFRLIVAQNLHGTALLNAINSYIYPFVPKYTALPDVTFHWFEWLSFLNPILHVTWAWNFQLSAADPTHVLPILAGLATFVQLRMSQAATKKNNAGAKSGAPDPSQQTMAMMQYVMPFVTAFIGFTVPAGLALYWTVSSLFQVVQQYFVTGWGAFAPATSVATTSGKAVATKTTPAPATTGRVVEADKKVVSSNGSKNGNTVRPATATANGNGTAKLNGSDSVKLSTSSTGSGSSNGGSASSRNKNRSGSASARRRSGSRARR